MKKFLLSESDRRELAAILSQQRSAPPPHPNATPQKPVYEEGDSYWALPPCETGLPAAEMIDGKLKTIGVQCCAFRHVWGQDEMQPMLDVAGNPVRITVFNYYTRPENGLIQVYKHKDGSWTNEKPDRTTGSESRAITTPPPGFTDVDAGCEGDCYWQADQNGVWQSPTGGCQNSTSTTSTTTTSLNPNQPGTTRYPPQPATTPSPCIKTKCTLVCIDTSTTPAPDEYGVPVPYVAFRYALKDGSVCPAGCTCYGLGDPCFLVEGELVSNCIGAGPTTTSTTTPNPNAPPCEEADFIFGTVPPNYFRAARKRNGTGTWEQCADCPERTVPLFPLGGEKYRRHDWERLADVYETPCVKSPCVESDTLGNPDRLVVYRAYHWDQQVANWGWQVGEKFYDYPNKRFKANWFLCSGCEGSSRPQVPPPFWIYENENRNLNSGITYDPVSNTYYYYTTCTAGMPCDTCKRAPTRTQYDFQGPDDLAPPTTTNTTTTGGPTTTPNPFCGCSRPDYCPVPFECTRTVCSKTAAEVFPSGASQTTVPPPSSLPCFPSNTTTSGPTTSTSAPSTTNAPNQCIGASGQLCICATSTAPPSGGTCPPDFCAQFAGNPICPTIVCVECPPPPDNPNPPDPPCSGSCYWVGHCAPNDGCFWVWIGAGGFLNTSYGLCSVGGCVCPVPTGTPTCGEEKWTSCFDNRPPTSTTTGGPTTTPEPCGCCRTTTPNPCLVGSCRYSGNSSGGWTLRRNSCRTACPCPPASAITIPGTPCDTLVIECGGSPPTRPPTSTTSTTTACPPAIPPGPTQKCCFRYQGQPAGFWSCTVVQYPCLCQAGARGPQGSIITEAYLTSDPDCSTGGACGPTSTPAPGACCLTFFQGTAPPVIQCVSAPDTAACAALGGSFRGAGTNCSSDPCSTTTTTAGPTTTTTAGPTTTTTTNNPGANCCFYASSPAYCVAGYGSVNCVNDGGLVVSSCAGCFTASPGGTTTTGAPTTTTTLPPGVTTTPNPCDSCYASNCGCSTGPSVICPPGEQFSCDVCGCGTTTTTTGAPPPL